VYAGYSGVQNLRNISLTVESKQIVALIGSNGAGKTTTLNVISGLLKPYSGSVFLDGERIDQLPAYKIVEKGISHIPEGRRIFPRMTVLENLEVGAYNLKAKDERKKLLEMVFNLFPRLKERVSQDAGTLSGGEQQMLAIARGLMSKPKVLLLDEPSLGIMPTLVDKIFEVLLEIKKHGVTMLLVEQNAYEALQLCDKAYVIENGEITIQGGKNLLENEHVKKSYLGL
jgi:branched-chain amino acid transport system ATP-binding protein